MRGYLLAITVGIGVVAIAAGACGKTVEPFKADAGSGGSGDGGGGDGGGAWTTLISLPWTNVAGNQEYQCDRAQVPDDVWISSFRPVNPIGTHHLVLTIDPTDTETGDYACSAESGTLSGQMVYAAGIGTIDMDLPTGVAVHLAAGTWLNLNVHLFNEQDGTLTGTSGVQIQTVAQSAVQNEADMVFSGTFNIDVPSNGQPTTASGGCSTPAEWTVFTLWPHEHELGIHQTLSIGGTTVLDQPYSFTNQIAYPMSNMVVPQGTPILTTCTYELAAATCSASTPCTVGTCNDGSGGDNLCHVEFGQSTLDEMCFTGIYKYPASTSDTAFTCVTGSGL